MMTWQIHVFAYSAGARASGSLLILLDSIRNTGLSCVVLRVRQEFPDPAGQQCIFGLSFGRDTGRDFVSFFVDGRGGR